MQEQGDLPVQAIGDGNRGNRVLSSLFIRILLVIVAINIVLLAIGQFITQVAFVDGDSMEPTLQFADRVVALKTAYLNADPKPGDIVVFKSTTGPKYMIKRVIAVGGQTLEVKNGQVFVDGAHLPEAFIAGGDTSHLSSQKIPQGFMFVMGDNRPRSIDSRYYGAVPMENAIGKAAFVAWPFGHFKFLY